MPRTPRRRTGATSRQEAQKQLIKEARTIPGVEDVLKAYGKLERYAGAQMRAESPAFFATGGNG